ncbi:MAG: hypothetical protein HZA11_10485 [Nitrospirae bacterium]|nr:hypothetical protein [Nitrospirota bacterium]
MAISICGIGWINKEEYGCVMNGMRFNYRDSSRGKALSRKEIFSYPFKNFGRLDNISRLACYAVALALKDAGIKYFMNHKHDIGIICTNKSGSLQSDILYFKDYLESGRTLSRGNLFIYTLPSSPLGEAAIHFGLQGPLLYVTAADKPLQAALDTASEMILLNESPAMLAGMAEEDEAVYFVLARDSDSIEHVLCDVARARAILGKDMLFSKMIKEFSSLKEQRGQE